MALLEPRVVLGADPGQQRYLAALEPGYPAGPGFREAHLARGYQGPPGPQILAEAACCHAESLRQTC